MDVVTVVIDGRSIRPLTYRNLPAPDSAEVGDAVEVELGATVLNGMVVGPGSVSPGVELKTIRRVWGRRSTPEAVCGVSSVAESQLGYPDTMLRRMAPKTGKGASPSPAGPAVLCIPGEFPEGFDPSGPVVEVVRDPSWLPERVAALEALRLTSSGGQVLILCPSKVLAGKVFSEFSSGAVRVDAAGNKSGGWASFRDGLVPVGVGVHTSSLFGARDLVGIVVVEEQDEGHRPYVSPRVHSRDVAVSRCRASNLRCTLISGSPSSWGVAVADEVVHLPGGFPDTFLEDVSWEGGFRFPARVIHQSDKVVEAGGRVGVVRVSKPKVVCSSCTSPADQGDPCPSCGGMGRVVVGITDESIEASFGKKVKVLSARDVFTARGYDFLIVPDVQSLLDVPSLQPYSLVSDVLSSSFTAVKEGGSVAVLTRGEPHPVVVSLVTNHEVMQVARNAWRAAKALSLPPYGRIVELNFPSGPEPTIPNVPGIVHGPYPTQSGWVAVIRCEQRSLRAVKHALRPVLKVKGVRHVVS